jgi:hypothetical protein
MADYNALSDGRPDGAILGNAASDKVGFFGIAPTTQPTDAAQAALTATTAGAIGFNTTAGFLAMVAQLENIRASLVALGLLKGS